MPTLRTLIIAIALAASSCATMFEPPPRFLVVDEGGGQLKAITPEESKMWLRDFTDKDEGGLAFWTDALRRDFKDNRGYTIITETDTQDAAGVPGREIVLESTVNGQPYRELVAVFVYDGTFSDTIRVVEYVAEKATFDTEVASVRTSVAAMKR